MEDFQSFPEGDDVLPDLKPQGYSQPNASWERTASNPYPTAKGIPSKMGNANSKQSGSVPQNQYLYHGQQRPYQETALSGEAPVQTTTLSNCHPNAMMPQLPSDPWNTEATPSDEQMSLDRNSGMDGAAYPTFKSTKNLAFSANRYTCPSPSGLKPSRKFVFKQFNNSPKGSMKRPWKGSGSAETTPKRQYVPLTLAASKPSPLSGVKKDFRTASDVLNQQNIRSQLQIPDEDWSDEDFENTSNRPKAVGFDDAFGEDSVSDLEMADLVIEKQKPVRTQVYSYKGALAENLKKSATYKTSSNMSKVFQQRQAQAQSNPYEGAFERDNYLVEKVNPDDDSDLEIVDACDQYMPENTVTKPSSSCLNTRTPLKTLTGNYTRSQMQNENMQSSLLNEDSSQGSENPAQFGLEWDNCQRSQEYSQEDQHGVRYPLILQLSHKKLVTHLQCIK